MQSEYELVALERLHPWEANPRNNAHVVEQVATSLQRFGFQAPIVALRSGRILAGHTRYAAAQMLELEHVPVKWSDLEPGEAEAYALADNRLSEEAEWDTTALGKLLLELDGGGIDVTGLGFSDEDLEQLLHVSTGEASAEGPRDPFDVGSVDVIDFKFGDFTAKVERRVYDAFKSKLAELKTTSESPLISDVLVAWLGLGAS